MLATEVSAFERPLPYLNQPHIHHLLPACRMTITGVLVMIAHRFNLNCPKAAITRTAAEAVAVAIPCVLGGHIRRALGDSLAKFLEACVSVLINLLFLSSACSKHLRCSKRRVCRDLRVVLFQSVDCACR